MAGLLSAVWWLRRGLDGETLSTSNRIFGIRKPYHSATEPLSEETGFDERRIGQGTVRGKDGKERLERPRGMEGPLMMPLQKRGKD